jgi:hypothetical protein
MSLITGYFECANDLIVTGGRHLRALKAFQGIGIANIAGFLYFSIPSQNSIYRKKKTNHRKHRDTPYF